MSLFSWFSGSKKPAKAAAQPESSGLSRMESTKPYPPRGAPDPHGNAKPANRKHERMARRELLYAVVRETMAKAGVISASYKFKVLSLDARGREFLVMVDLAREYGSETSGLAEIEAMIAQMAKARYDIVVTAVYWRMNEHVAVGQPSAARGPARPAHPTQAAQAPHLTAAAHAGHAAHPAAASQPHAQAQPTAAAPGPLSRNGERFEPIQQDEVEAFKQALARGVSGQQAMAGEPGAGGARPEVAVRHGPQSYTLLTGFEDTELAEGDGTHAPGALSATQYGELR
jgi:hypothetical protein